MRVARRRAGLAGGAAVERETASDEVYGRRPEAAADRIGAAADLRAGGRRQETEPEFAQQRQAPLLIGETRPGNTRGQGGGTGAELRPMLAQTVPRLRDGFVHTLPGGECVVLGTGTRQRRVGIRQTAQQVRREQSALRTDRLKPSRPSAGHLSSVQAAGRTRRGCRPATRVRRLCRSWHVPS